MMVFACGFVVVGWMAAGDLILDGIIQATILAMGVIVMGHRDDDGFF